MKETGSKISEFYEMILKLPMQFQYHLMSLGVCHNINVFGRYVRMDPWQTGEERAHQTLCQLLSGSQPNTSSPVLREPAWQGNRSPRTSGDTPHLMGVTVRGPINHAIKRHTLGILRLCD